MNDIPKQIAIIKNFSVYSVAIILVTVLTLLQSVLLRHILQPSDFGTYMVLITVAGYLTNAHLGLPLYLEREIPYLTGRKDHVRIMEIKSAVLGGMLLLLTCSVLLGWISLAFFPSLLGERLRHVIGWVFLILFFLGILNYYESVARGSNDFTLISKRTVLTGILNLGITCSLAYWFGLSGGLMGLTLTYLASVGLYVLHPNYYIRPRLKIQMFYEQLSIGFPLMLGGLIFTLFSSVDSIIVYRVFGSQATGYYSLVPLVFSVVILFPRLVSIVTYPQIIHTFGVSNDPAHIKKQIDKVLEVLVAINGLIVGLLFILLEPLIKLFLPDYLPGVGPARIMLFGGIFMGSIFPFGHFLIATKQFRQGLVINGALLLLEVLLLWLVSWCFHPTLEHVAFVIAMSYIIYSIVLYSYVNHQFFAWPKLLGQLKIFFGKFIYIFVVLTIVIAVGHYIQSLVSEWLQSLGMILLYFLLLLPSLYRLNRKYQLLINFRQILSQGACVRA